MPTEIMRGVERRNFDGQRGSNDQEVEFEAGGHEWTGIGALRIPCIENGPGAVGTKFGANRPPQYTDPPAAGIPSWVWTIGIIIVIAVIRGCLSMRH